MRVGLDAQEGYSQIDEDLYADSRVRDEDIHTREKKPPETFEYFPPPYVDNRKSVRENVMTRDHARPGSEISHSPKLRLKGSVEELKVLAVLVVIPDLAREHHVLATDAVPPFLFVPVDGGVNGLKFHEHRDPIR